MFRSPYNSVVEAVFSHAESAPDKLCLADETRTVTYSQYRDEILRTASAMQDLGISSGQRVVVEASQTITYLASQLAMHLMGVIFVPVERGCAWNKILHIAQISDASAVIVNAVKGDCDSFNVITASSLHDNASHFHQTDMYSFPDSESISEILFSTGTTGTEKGIVITFDNNIALAENVINGVGITDDNVEMIPSPLNHSHGLRRYYANMVAGQTVVLFTSVMNVRLMFDMMDKYGVNSMDLVPTALGVILKLSKGYLANYSSVMRYIQLGSAPISDADMDTVRKLLPDTQLYNFYGSTESGCICIYDFNTDNRKQKCIGRPACNAEIVIADEERKPIMSSFNNTGLLCSFGRMNMAGYWKDEKATAEVMANGFIYSNDEAYIDEDGDIILLGRKGDVINSGGNKISPEEIEEAARAHESVADCGCIGIKDDLKGSVPKLYIQLKDGSQFDSASIRESLSQHLEPYKIPAVIERIDSIPRSFNGKLLRRKLKEHHEKNSN